MINIQNKIDGGKKSLDSALRKKALEDVHELLTTNNIDIDDIDDSDLEELVASKVSDMENQLKGFSLGSGLVIALGSII